MCLGGSRSSRRNRVRTSVVVVVVVVVATATAAVAVVSTPVPSTSVPSANIVAIDDQLIVKTSTIASAGQGLFYDERFSGKVIKAGTTLCYYTGHRHNFQSQQLLQDKSYLLNVSGGMFVDPGPIHSIKARFINDPLNEDFVNCTFVPEPEHFRCAVVAQRDISPGEELFVSYGAQYWSQQKQAGTVFAA